jgi:glycosyltransferase involved in cell wall biosynthesis
MGYPTVERYEALARTLGVSERVTFLGRLPYSEAPRYLALGDVAVAPKKSEAEGYGKLVNYMAAGLPIVAFDTPLSREYLGPLGRYVASGNPTALADGLAAALTDPGRGFLGAALRKRAIELYSSERLGAELDAVLRRLCDRPGAPLESMEPVTVQLVRN